MSSECEAFIAEAGDLGITVVAGLVYVGQESLPIKGTKASVEATRLVLQGPQDRLEAPVEQEHESKARMWAHQFNQHSRFGGGSA